MLKHSINLAISILMILVGLFFASNIYVIGNRQAAVAMHNDLAPNAGAVIANLKVIVCFVAGLLYLAAAWGLLKRRREAVLAGVVGFVLFDGLYVVELALWGSSYPRVWLWFGVFGGLSRSSSRETAGAG